MNYLKLMRPFNLIVITLTMFLFRICITNSPAYTIHFGFINGLTDFTFLLLVITTILVAASGYIINDIADIDIDTINKPNKVIINTKIPEEKAYSFYKIICFFAIIGCLVLTYFTKNLKLSTVPILLMIILNFYAFSFKKQFLIGNIIIAIASAFSILLIGLYEASVIQQNNNAIEISSGIYLATLVYATFAFLTTLIREIIKDIEDIEGDKQFDCNTIAVKLGIQKTKIIVTFLGFILIILEILFAYFFYQIQINIAFWYSIILAILAVLFLILLAIFKTKKQYHLLSNVLKLYMLIGIFSMYYFYVYSGTGPAIFNQFFNFIKSIF